MKIITRKEAIAAGEKRYFTGKPCPHGHVCERFVSAYGCVICIDLSKKENRKDPEFREKELEYKKHYYEENRDKILEYAARYWRENPNAKENCRKNRGKYVDRIKKYNAFYWAENRERLSANFKKWCDENRDHVRTLVAQRRARKRNAEGLYTSDDIALIYQEQAGVCPGCLTGPLEKYHVDHVMPLVLGGSNWPDNIQILCGACNSRKNRMHPLDWYKTLKIGK